MKVIKPGNGLKGWSKKLKCTGVGNNGYGCQALLLVEQQDLFRTASHCRDETDYYITFKCPECGTLTDVAPKDCSLSAYSLPSFNNNK